MMATVPHVISGLGLRKFQADGFLLTRVYVWTDKFNVGALIRPSKECNRTNVIRLYVYVYTCVEQQIRGHRGISGLTIW